MAEVTFGGPTFLSPRDEASFFAWIAGLPCVTRVVGSGRKLSVHLRSARLSADNLRELIAVLYRYDIDMAPLAKFANSTNHHWFRDPRAFWYSRVFPSTTASRRRTASRRP